VEVGIICQDAGKHCYIRKCEHPAAKQQFITAETELEVDKCASMKTSSDALPLRIKALKPMSHLLPQYMEFDK